MSRKRYSDEDHAEMRRMYLAGKLYREIADHFGCSLSTVNMHCGCLADSSIRPRTRKSKYDHDMVRALYEEIGSYYGVAKKLGCSPSTVMVIVQKGDGIP